MRVFVGIKVAPQTASQLVQYAAALETPLVRPVAAADIHLTLVPPWNENETSIPDALAKLARVAAKFGVFPLIFQHVGYGPQPRRPRLLWVECAVTDTIAALHTALLEVFGQTDERPFHPHVTLARIRAGGSAVARNYPIDRSLGLTQRVESVEFFQSPPLGGSGYHVLASSRLAENPAPEPRF